MKRLYFALLLVSMGLSHFMTAALGQEPQPEGEIIASYPIIARGEISLSRITKVDAVAGTAILSLPGQPGMFINFPRGEVLLLIQDEQTRDIGQVIRADVDEILEKGEALIRLGKEAVRAIRPGPVYPVQPIAGMFNSQDQNVFPLSSRKFRQLPELSQLVMLRKVTMAN